MKKELLEFSTNKTEILDKKSSIVNLSKRLFRYTDHEQDPNLPDPEPSRSDKLIENINEILLVSKSPALDGQKARKEPPFFRCILSLMVLFFLCSGGFFGPFYLLVGVNPLVRIFWRQIMTTFLLIPIALCERRLEGKHEISRDKTMHSVLTGFLHSIWSLAFGLSVDSTSMLHVYLLSSLDIAFLSIWKRFVNKKMAGLELFGVIAIAICIILVFIDKSETIISFKGDLIALCAGLLFAVYSYNFENFELNSPFWLCSLLISLFSSIFLMIFSGIFGGSWDFDENKGVFGIFTPKWFFIHLIIALSAGIFYFNFLNVLRKHYQEQIVRFLVNIVTFLGGFIAYYLGFNDFPSFLGLLAAGIAVIAGFFIVEGRKKSEGLEFQLDRDEGEEDQKKSGDFYYMEMGVRE